MIREFTCIGCPQSCEIEVTLENGEIVCLAGNLCPRGRDYVRRELENPVRTVTTSVLVAGGELAVASVRTTAAVPKDRIFDVMREIRRMRLDAPVAAGQVVIKNVLGLGADVVATKSVGRIFEKAQ